MNSRDKLIAELEESIFRAKLGKLAARKDYDFGRILSDILGNLFADYDRRIAEDEAELHRLRNAPPSIEPSAPNTLVAPRETVAKTRIFISYARKDGAELARRLFDAFNARSGWSAWMDIKLQAEELFSMETQKALLAADYVVVVLSPDVNRDNPPSFVQRELLFVTQEEVDKKVFAVKAATCYVPVIIAGVTWLPFHMGDFAVNFETLCAKIEDAGISPKALMAILTPNRREMEQAYLRELAKQYSVWGKVYTDLGAERRQTPDKLAPKIADDEAFSVLSAMFEHVEMAFAQHTTRGHSADDDAETQPLETFANLRDALKRFPRVALVGDPGCGKTTALRRITLDLALAATNDELGTAPLPILVPLGNFNDGSLDAYLATNFGGLPLRDYLPDHAVVLLDGLNETAAEHVAEVQRWLNANPKTRVIVTCRKLDYLERHLDLQRVDVQPLDPIRIRQFMANWGLAANAVEELFWGLCGDRIASVWAVWRDAGDTFERFWTAEKLDNEMPAFQKTTYAQDDTYNTMRRAMIDEKKLPGLLGLVSNPFLLTQTIFIYSKRRAVPRNRSELFTLFVAALMEQRGKLAIIPKQREWIAEPIQRGALAALATWLQAERQQTFATVDEIWGVFQRYIGRGAEKPVDLLSFAISANILEKSRDTLRFSHQLLQEYFATYNMEEMLKRGDSAERYFPGEQWWEPSGWEESAVLLCGMYISAGQVSADAWRVVEWLTPVNPIAAWRCIVENGLDERHPAAKALKVPRAGVRAAPLARARWGVKIAENDTRAGVGLRPDGLPDIVWCEVPAGEFIYQTGQFLTLPTFHIAKYLVTYKQFQAFIDAPDGFANAKWWDGRREVEQQRGRPGDQAFKFWNHPRETVSWYDVMAFCRWLTVKLGYGITLPTEEQWEKAARGTYWREYPYSVKFDPTKGNTEESGIGQTSVVGVFPDGASPYGVMDMSGNTWEWTLTKYDIKNSNGSTRTLRGGSWYDDLRYARSTFRLRADPNVRSDNYGFRLVLASRPF